MGAIDEECVCFVLRCSATAVLPSARPDDLATPHLPLGALMTYDLLQWNPSACGFESWFQLQGKVSTHLVFPVVNLMSPGRIFATAVWWKHSRGASNMAILHTHFGILDCPGDPSIFEPHFLRHSRTVGSQTTMSPSDCWYYPLPLAKASGTVGNCWRIVTVVFEIGLTSPA